MMEIPAGKECEKYNADYTAGSCCPFLDESVYCGLMDEDECMGKRTPACLAAYPNGATVTITAKEKA